ncbi:hypothetical protein PNEG_01326 [Pneumocystis murina B123]|uniref:Uncharacterized protein n=1 Tax=Pneumocystis murina (strain B123) TaxID=1069680 RepID=M7NPI8_PNEMU|nr:hypothetical protein PNEG_01326 [Pneumocystis murina B123]EMR10623.1 hypothetical protein PNEG_01326 [Pneumocystis murina B123]
MQKQEKNQNEFLESKSHICCSETRKNDEQSENETIKDNIKTFNTLNTCQLNQKASDVSLFQSTDSYEKNPASSRNTSIFNKSSKESPTKSNQSLPSISSLSFHHPMMSIQSVLGEEPISWNTNTESSNKNFSTETINNEIDNRGAVSSLIHPYSNEFFHPNINMSSTRPINQHHSFNNILIHEDEAYQKKQSCVGYQHFHSFNQSSQLPFPLFSNNVIIPSTLPSLFQGHQPLNQNIDRGKLYPMNHMEENYNSPTSKVKFSNKSNTSPKAQKNTRFRSNLGTKSADYHENEYKVRPLTRHKSHETNQSSYKTNALNTPVKTSQETSQKKSQKDTKKQLQPKEPLPRPKLIVKNDAVMNFIKDMEEKDLGEYIYTPSSPIPCLDGKLNGILTIRIARQYFHKSENDKIKKRALWGTDIYTDDSDIVAILLHTGRLGRKKPSSDAIVKVRVLPRLIKYSGSLRYNIMSRGWKTRHDGESIMIEDLKWVEDKTKRKGRKDMKERIAARYQLQLSL